MDDVIIAVVGIVATFGVPLVWILTTHQRKMAELIHNTHQNQLNANNDALASEVRDLKQLVYQQSIALDNLSNEVRRNASPQQTGSISSRLGQQ